MPNTTRSYVTCAIFAFVSALVFSSCLPALMSESEKEQRKKEDNERFEFNTKLLGQWRGECKNGGSEKSEDYVYIFEKNGKAKYIFSEYGARDCKKDEVIAEWSLLMNYGVVEKKNENNKDERYLKVKFDHFEVKVLSLTNVLIMNLSKTCGYNDWSVGIAKEIETASECNTIARKDKEWFSIIAGLGDRKITVEDGAGKNEFTQD